MYDLPTTLLASHSPAIQPTRLPIPGHIAVPTAEPNAPPASLPPALATSTAPCPIPSSFVALKILGNSNAINIKLPSNGIFLPTPLKNPFTPPRTELLPAILAALAPAFVVEAIVEGNVFNDVIACLKNPPFVAAFFATEASTAFPPPLIPSHKAVVHDLFPLTAALAA